MEKVPERGQPSFIKRHIKEEEERHLSSILRSMTGCRLSPVRIDGERLPGRSTYNLDACSDGNVWARNLSTVLCLHV